MIRDYELTKEEETTLRGIESGKFAEVTGKERIRLERVVAEATRNTLERNKNINIRLSERDLLKLKARAAEQGLPYQTLISSIIHQFNNKAA